MAATTPFTGLRFASRWTLSAFLVFSTYNPSGHSYYHWVMDGDEGFLSVKIFVGAILMWAYLSVLPIVWGAMGPVGIGVTAAVMAMGGLVLWDYGLLDDLSPSFYPYAAIGGIATVIAVGVTWGHVNLQVWHLKLVRKIAPKL